MKKNSLFSYAAIRIQYGKFFQRCAKDTADKIFTEKEWLEYKQKQIELEKKTERENCCSEIISKYDGYIN